MNTGIWHPPRSALASESGRANRGCLTLLVLFFALTTGAPVIGGLIVRTNSRPATCGRTGSTAVRGTHECVANADMGPYIALLALGAVVFVGLFYWGWARKGMTRR
jgi:hypothetical protein